MLFLLSWLLINIKKVSYDDALNIINSWLSKCGKLRRLDQNFDYTVRYALKYSAKNGHKPIKYDTLKLEYCAIRSVELIVKFKWSYVMVDWLGLECKSVINLGLYHLSRINLILSCVHFVR